MPRPFREVIASIPLELGPEPRQIGIPDIVIERDYDLVCVGAPTWWLSTDAPMPTFLESDTASTVFEGKSFVPVVCRQLYWKHNPKTVKRLGTKQGGTYTDGIDLRYHGVEIPPSNIEEHHSDGARIFAKQLATHLVG